MHSTMLAGTARSNSPLFFTGASWVTPGGVFLSKECLHKAGHLNEQLGENMHTNNGQSRRRSTSVSTSSTARLRSER